jgi:polyhydroxyalkanoate synthesis regulator phasin
MVRDALRSYLALATGLVDVPRQQAVRVAKALVNQGEATAEQAGAIADDLLGTSRANRDALLQLIRYEVDRGLGRLGLATADEVRDLTDRVHRLEGELRSLRGGAGEPAGAAAKKAAPATRNTAPTKASAVTKASGPKKAAAPQKAGAAKNVAAAKKVTAPEKVAKKAAPAKKAAALRAASPDGPFAGNGVGKPAPAAKVAGGKPAAENGTESPRADGAGR